MEKAQHSRENLGTSIYTSGLDQVKKLNMIDEYILFTT
jgi:hypothetical protein